MLERDVLTKDRLMEFAELRARLDPELLDEGVTSLLVCLERLGLASGPVEREYQAAAQVLPERMLTDECLELADERGMSPEPEFRLDPLLKRREAQLLEPGNGGLGEWLVGDVGERGPPPLGECLAKQPRRLAGIAGA